MSTPISSTPSTTTDTQTQTNQALQGLLQSGPAVSFGGLVSGLNTQQIIQALLAADQAPIIQLQANQAHEQAKLNAWQEINTKLQAVQAAADTLSLQGTVSAKQVTFAGPSGTFASGTVSPTAATGSFQLQIDQIATATRVTSTAGIGSAIVGTDIATNSSKLSTPVSRGTFSIGVTDPVTGNVTYHSVAVTAGEDFDQILADIGTQTSGDVTGSVVGNTIQLTSHNGQPIALGTGGDTSNFLSVTKLLAQPGATTMTSSGPVGVANPNVALNQANIAGLTSTTTGSISINGVTINYNSASDSLSTVLDRINASSAGVTASYDPNSDTVTFTSSKTGNIDVSLVDGTGNLLGSLNVLAPGAHTLGKSAKYEVNGGPAQYSLTNTVKNLVPGVTVMLQAVTPAGSPLTANVSLNNSVGKKAVQDFVTAYNAVVDLIQKDTAYDTKTRVAGIFLGDFTLTAIQQQLDNGLFIAHGLSKGLTPPFTDISTIGLSTGPVGSQPGTTLDLQFDSDKFDAALQSNPAAVTNLVNTVFGQLSKSVLNVVKPFGLVDGAIQSETRQLLDFQHEIDSQNDLLRQQEQMLTAEFNQLDAQLAHLQASSSTGASVLAALSSTSSGQSKAGPGTATASGSSAG